ncbi:unnamed protein product, partial [marine sediment metagenome]
AEAKGGAKALKRQSKEPLPAKQPAKRPPPLPKNRFAKLANRVGALVVSAAANEAGPLRPEAKVMRQFNTQFEHFPDDAPACDICGAITVRNGTCYKCFNCGNSMGCS